MSFLLPDILALLQLIIQDHLQHEDQLSVYYDYFKDSQMLSQQYHPLVLS